MSDPAQLVHHLFGQAVSESELRRAAWPGLSASPPAGVTRIQWRWLRQWDALRQQWSEESASAMPCRRNSSELLAFLHQRLAGCRNEHFIMLLLDSQLGLLGTETLSLGTLNEARVYPREVLTRVIDYQAAGVILAHNHPSGNATPSAQDCALTERLARLLESIEVSLHDHFVVTQRGAHSIVFDQFFPKRLS